MKTNNKITDILKEIQSVLSKINDKQVEEFIHLINEADTIVTVGAGRVGMSAKAFAMRLGHLGKKAFNYGDATVPNIGKGDLLIVASGSGETQTIYDLVTIAHKNGAQIALITGNPQSRMGELADAIVHLPAPSKTKPIDGFSSIQPMTTLNEQCLFIFFDAIVLQLMDQLKETHETMWRRHSNLE